MSDDDSDSMMHSMMGFSSFGTQRPAGKKASDAPPSTGSNAAPVAKKAKTGAAATTIAQSMQQSGISPSSAPGPVNQTEPDISTVPTAPSTSARSAPGATTTSTTTFQSTTAAPPGLSTMQPLPRPSDGTNTTSSFAHPSERTNATSSIAYTSPTNPTYRLTPSELNLLRNGRPNARGDMVFFKPGFIDENPWKVLQDVAREERGVRNEG